MRYEQLQYVPETEPPGFLAEDQALPLGYGRIGERALILMFSDPNVRPYSEVRRRRDNVRPGL